MPKEIETKFRIESPAVFRKRLKKRGAKFVSKNLESDIYYNIQPHHKNLEVIRLRFIGKKGLFTIKSHIPDKDSYLYKVTNELEATLDDARTFENILNKLGFEPSFRKEKIREMYTLKKAKVCLDKLPHIGLYAEIEAPKKKIKEIARTLGLDIKEATPKTYLQLFNEYKTEHKKPRLELVF